MSKINLCEPFSAIKSKTRKDENNIGNHCLEGEKNIHDGGGDNVDHEDDDSEDYDYSDDSVGKF